VKGDRGEKGESAKPAPKPPTVKGRPVFPPIQPPPTGLSAQQEQRLQELLQKYRADQITPAQYQLLLAIRGHDAPEPPVVGELAEALQLRHHSVVELVDRAEAAGLVHRTPDPRDQRRQQVRLTGTGRHILEQLARAHRDELRRFRTQMVDLLPLLD
jgi:DNA-binding MarR family transcriptional regulator